jgi:hypothetical protein
MGRPAGLDRGTEVRSRRAALKRRVEAGTLDLSRLLTGSAAESDEETALDMRIGELLRAVPGIGDATAREICSRSNVEPDARLSTLPIRRRCVVAENMAAIR